MPQNGETTHTLNPGTSNSRYMFADLAKTCTSDDFREVKNRKTDKQKTKKLIIGRSDRTNTLGVVAKSCGVH